MQFPTITLTFFVGSLLALLILLQDHKSEARSLDKHRRNVDSIKIFNNRKRREEFEELDDFIGFKGNSDEGLADRFSEEEEEDDENRDEVNDISQVVNGETNHANKETDDNDDDDDSSAESSYDEDSMYKVFFDGENDK